MKTYTLKQNRKHKLRKLNILCVIPLLLTILLLFAFCDKEEDRTTYYKVKGEGYFFDAVNNKPIKDASIIVFTGTEGGGGLFGLPSPDPDTFKTNAKGFYQVSFIKEYNNRKATQYTFKEHSGPNLVDSSDPGIQWYRTVSGFPDIALPVEDVENAKQTIVFDTIKYYQEKFY